MTTFAAVHAEALRTVTTRAALAIAGTAALYPALGLIPVLAGSPAPAVDARTLVQVQLGAADAVMVAALLLGALAVAGEHRHGTIVPTLLASPRRGRLLAARFGFQAALAATVAVAAGVVGLAAWGWYLASRGVSLGAAADAATVIAASGVVAALYSIAGGAVAAVVRNQTAVVAGLLGWVLAVEGALPVLLGQPGLRRWLPGGAADRVLSLADPGVSLATPLAGLAALAGLVALLVVAGFSATRSADIH